MEDITLKGTQAAVDAACAQLNEYVQEFENNNNCNGAIKNGNSPNKLVKIRENLKKKQKMQKPKAYTGEDAAGNGNALDFSREALNTFVRQDLRMTIDCFGHVDDCEEDEDKLDEQREEEELFSQSQEKEDDVEEEEQQSVTRLEMKSFKIFSINFYIKKENKF